MNVNILKIIIFSLFPCLYFLIAIFNLKDKVNKNLYVLSLLVIIFYYNPPETSDFWRVKEMYEQIKTLSVIEVLKLKVDFLIPLVMYIFNIANLPFKIFLLYIYIYYGVIIHIFNKFMLKRKYIIVFFVFAILSHSMRIIENPRFPLATVFFTYGILISEKKKKYLLYLITILIHLGYLPIILLIVTTSKKMGWIYKILYIISIFAIFLDINIIEKYVKIFIELPIANDYLKSKIKTYFINEWRVKETVKINWLYNLHVFYYILFCIYILIEKIRKSYLQNVLLLLLTFINILFYYKTLFYRYMTSIIILIAIYYGIEYGKKKLYFEKLMIIIHLMLVFYSSIMWIRLLWNGFGNMNWLSNIFYIIFSI